MTSGLGLSLALLFLLLTALFSSLPLLSLFIFFLCTLTFVAVFFIYNRYNCYNTLSWVLDRGSGSRLRVGSSGGWWSCKRLIMPFFYFE